MPAFDLVWDLLFPAKCPFCGQWLKKGDLLCPDCQGELPWLSGKAAWTAVELTRGCVSPLRYQGKVRDGIHDYKFHGKEARGKTLGVLIAQCVRDQGLDLETDLVTWAPLSKKRRRERGYDQARLLAESVGEELCLPVAETLTKVRDIPAQSGLEEEAARRANVLGAYEAYRPEGFAGKRLLLIDDVVTTGATLTECAKVLKLAGAAEVVCGTIAKAR